MLYAPRKGIVKVTKMDEDFKLETPYGTHYGFKNDFIGTDLDGNQKIIPGEYLKDGDFVEVEVVKKQSSEQYAEQLQHYYNNFELQPEEDSDYIKGKENGWSNK